MNVGTKNLNDALKNSFVKITFTVLWIAFSKKCSALFLSNQEYSIEDPKKTFPLE